MPIINETLALFGIEAEQTSRGNANLKLKGFNDIYKMSKALYSKLLESLNKIESHYIKLPKIQFGIEFEFVGTAESNAVIKFNTAMGNLVGIQNYFYAGKYYHNDGSKWILGKDSSIKNEQSLINQPTGYELTTPKLLLNNEAHIKLLSNVIYLIHTYLYGETNNSCGTHIHVSLIRDNIFKCDIRNTLLIYSLIEKLVFDPIVPSNRRRSKYCKPTSINLKSKYQKVSTRYCTFDENDKCTNIHYEFRQLEGTLDLNTIIYWTVLHSHILYCLLEYSTNETYIKSFVKRNIFDVLFYFDFDSNLINFFMKRILDFKSKALQQS